MGGARERAYAIGGGILWCGSGVGGEVMMLLWRWWGGGDMMMKVLTDGDGSRGGGMIVGVRRQVCLEVHYTEMSSIEKGIVALTLEDNVRSLVMVAAAYKHYSWYCKVLREIEGELSDEANVADPCKGAVSFESVMFEKRGRSIGRNNSQPLQKLIVSEVVEFLWFMLLSIQLDLTAHRAVYEATKMGIIQIQLQMFFTKKY
ncbi:hypothetical protein Tco_0409616 [Tanacetum coccineum]